MIMWNLAKTDVEYLTGKKFSNGMKLKISQPISHIRFRIEILEELVKEKKVIHLGCADHLPLIEQKIKRNIWLHKRLMENAKICYGFDIDEKSVMFLKEKLGYENIFVHNVIDDPIPDEVKNIEFDFMIVGEILEHIDNPVLFLSTVKKRYSNFLQKLVIAVPNAFSYNNFKYSFKNSELINSDHRYWFTPYTLSKVIFRSGMFVEKLILCQSHNFSKNQSKIHKIILNRYPMFSDTILAIASLNKNFGKFGHS